MKQKKGAGAPLMSDLLYRGDHAVNQGFHRQIPSTGAAFRRFAQFYTKF